MQQKRLKALEEAQREPSIKEPSIKDLPEETDDELDDLEEDIVVTHF